MADSRYIAKKRPNMGICQPSSNSEVVCELAGPRLRKLIKSGITYLVRKFLKSGITYLERFIL